LDDDDDDEKLSFSWEKVLVVLSLCPELNLPKLRWKAEISAVTLGQYNEIMDIISISIYRIITQRYDTHIDTRSETLSYMDDDDDDKVLKILITLSLNLIMREGVCVCVTLKWRQEMKMIFDDKNLLS